MKYKIILIMIMIGLPLFAIHENAGTTGFSFLKVDFAARSAALGNSFTALADDANAVFYNSSGLTQLTGTEIATTYLSYIDDIQCGSVVAAIPMSKGRTIALFSKFFTATDIRTVTDDFGYYDPYLSGDEFGMSNIVIGISDNRVITETLNIGLALKYIRESLDDYSASAVALDVSLLHQTINENIKVGLALKNLGRQLTYYTSNEHEETLPTMFTIGFSYHPAEKLLILLDINKPFKNDFNGSMGFEYKLHRMFSLRTGYKSNGKDWRTGGDGSAFAGLSFGAGFKLYKFAVDYAIVSYGDLGYLNQVSLTYKF